MSAADGNASLLDLAANPFREPGRGPAVGPRPFVRNGWLFLPATEGYYPSMVRLDTVTAVGVQRGGDEEDDPDQEEVYACVDTSTGEDYRTSVEFFDEVAKLVEDHHPESTS